MAKSARQPRACEPGSIEQQLDMCETGTKGEEVSRHSDDTQASLRDEESMHRNYNVDMSEEGREGDELSGDEHSGGLQGGESELQTQPEPSEGLPGDSGDIEEHQGVEREKHRMPA